MIEVEDTKTGEKI